MDERQENESIARRRISRRQFIRGMATVVGAGLLAACGPRSISGADTPFRTATPVRELPRPLGSQAPTATGMPEGTITLDQFLALSSQLTGVENLDPGLGQIYLMALESGTQGSSSLADVYAAASSGSNQPQDVDALQAGGFFDQQGVGELADSIIEMWYTGVYQLDGEDHVATFVDALAWKVLHFTKPPTICGHYGFWAEEPVANISPSVQYTPGPTPAEGS
jgi:hypothetical protein